MASFSSSARALLARRSLHPHRQRAKFSSFTTSPTGVTLSALNNTTFSYLWLRDACQEPTSVHPSTRQKLFRTSDIPLDIHPVDEGGLSAGPSGLRVKWTDGHESFYSRFFLERHASTENLKTWHKDIAPTSWTRESVSGVPDLFLSYDELNTPAGLVKGITQLCTYGLLFVRGVPNVQTSSEACELRALAERLGEIRPTFYGETWDVVNIKEGSTNIAYTNLDLGLHMDLLYFQHPPRYQILHCLRNRVQGGTSIFVDALHVAETLRQSHPEEFDILTSTPVAFHYVNDGHHLHYEHPTIELAPQGSFLPPSPSPSTPSTPTPAPISHINYSPPFQAPLPLSTPPAFFPALRRFTTLLNDPKNTYEYTLKEGDAVLFDNRRVLHARTAFSDGDAEGREEKVGEPNRWLKGCYLEADAIIDRGRVVRGLLERNGAS